MGSTMSAAHTIETLKHASSAHSKNSGFTLVEVMVVVVIIAILAAVAVPSYRDSVRKGRRTEAKTTLAVGAQMLEKCYTEVGSYLESAGCPSDATISAAGNNTEGDYTITSTNDRSTSAFTLTATAAGNQADDTGCAAFTISSTGAKKSFPSSGGTVSTTANTYGTCW